MLFYLQATCERILRRQFEDPLSEPIVEANALKFPAIHQVLNGTAPPVDGRRLRALLQSDFGALTYLLRHAANQGGRLTPTERLLALYFRALSRIAILGGRSVLLKMTAVLEYFANVLGERAKSARFAHATCSSAF